MQIPSYGAPDLGELGELEIPDYSQPTVQESEDSQPTETVEKVEQTLDEPKIEDQIVAEEAKN
jgi:hypothetical protein